MTKRTLFSRFKQLNFWNKLGVLGVIASILGLAIYFIPNNSNKLSIDNSSNSSIQQAGGDIVNNYYELKYYNSYNKELTISEDVKVLAYNILSAHKGYMKIELNKTFLNSNKGTYETLKYESGKYEPVTLTFKNDIKWGPGFIFTSPEHKRIIDIYLFQQFRFNVGGKMFFTDNFIFDLYFNDTFVAVVTQAGELKWEYPSNYKDYRMPPVKFGENNLFDYFDPEAIEKNKNAPEELKELKRFFANIVRQ